MVMFVRVKVRYFARFRDIAGVSEEEFDIPNNAKVKDLIELIKKKHPKFNDEIFEQNEEADVNVSKNGRYVDFDEELREGDIIALFPPVSGG